jgi:hypothetical protein
MGVNLETTPVPESTPPDPILASTRQSTSTSEELGIDAASEAMARAEAYVASEFAAGLRATEGFDDFEVRGFEVLDGLSALTGIGESVPIAAR